MDIWHLKIFCKVVEFKSFSKAAAAVRLSQPTVSAHIRDLERHLSCRLIDRLAKEAVPTKAGELLHEYAVKIIDMQQRAESAMADFQGKMKGRLVIGGSTIPGVYMLPRIIGAFSKQYPETRVCLINGSTESIVQQIVAGTLEMGIVGALSADTCLIQEKLIEDDMRLIVPEDHRCADQKQIRCKELFQEPFIAREPGSGTLKSIRESLLQQGMSMDDLKVIAEMGSTEAVIQGIKSRVGVSILSTMAVAEELRLGSLRALRVAGLDLRRNFYLTFHGQRSASPLQKVFVKFIKSMSLP
jgi:DNA-binding transcriptional LysR family regulator